MKSWQLIYNYAILQGVPKLVLFFISDGNKALYCTKYYFIVKIAS